ALFMSPVFLTLGAVKRRNTRVLWPIGKSAYWPTRHNSQGGAPNLAHADAEAAGSQQEPRRIFPVSEQTSTCDSRSLQAQQPMPSWPTRRGKSTRKGLQINTAGRCLLAPGRAMHMPACRAPPPP